MNFLELLGIISIVYENVARIQSGSLTSFSTGELGSTEAVQNKVWTKTVTTHRSYGPGFCCHRGML